MAGFLRPRRGRRSTAESQAIILKRGEVFFECPDTGVGTGTGKIKVGDGTTAYADLPYFMDLSSVTTDVAGSAIAFTESTTTDNATLLASIASGATLKTMISAIKKLLSNLDTSVTQLNNDLVNHTHTQYALSSHTHSNYVTSSDVVSIVNNNINNGSIEVKGSMSFSSSKVFSVNRNNSLINYSGSGFVFISTYKQYGSEGPFVYIDGKEIYCSYKTIPKDGGYEYPDQFGVTIPFSSSVKISCTSRCLGSIDGVVALF